MSSYIIAGSADSLDTAYCEEIARRIKAKYNSIDFRIVIKHPSEWDDYLQQICRIYGFLNKSNPIIYTYHGKIIGNKQSFVDNTVKYFGLQQDTLIVENLTNKINMKQAEEALKRKQILKNKIKTLQQKIEHSYKELLKSGEIKHQFKDSESFLVNGIEYQLRNIQGLVKPINFPLNKEIPIDKQIIEPDPIDILKQSALDKIPQQGGKQAFVTNNQPVNQSLEKMSEASRTNRLHSSVMSRDGDSKINKESSKQKQQIDEQFDDVADFNDHSMEAWCISQIGDNFYLAFEKNTYIPGEMVLYLNQSQNNGNMIRIYNDGRAVIGHRTLVKEIYYEHHDTSPGIDEEEQNVIDDIAGEAASIEKIQTNENNGENNDQVKKQQNNEAAKEEQIKKIEAPINQKSKTEPNIPEQQDCAPDNKGDEIQSEQHTDLNLISNLNYHTLYILKPLSSNQLKRILYLMKETNTVACLQFLPENPNPKIKVYDRQLLLGDREGTFPLQKLINKQLEDGQYECKCISREHEGEPQNFDVKVINDVGFNHYYFELNEQMNDEKLARMLKYTIDEILNLEQKLKKQIGYNLIFTKKYVMLVTLTEPYKVYGKDSLYFDSLAYLGYVCIVQTQEGYQMKKKLINSGETIRQALARCSGFELND